MPHPERNQGGTAIVYPLAAAQIHTVSYHGLEQNYPPSEPTGKYRWAVLPLPHSVVCVRSWHIAISRLQSKKCTGVAAVCILAH